MFSLLTSTHALGIDGRCRALSSLLQRLRPGLGVQPRLFVLLPLPQPELFSIALPRFRPLTPRLRSNSRCAAGVRFSLLPGVAGGAMLPGVAFPLWRAVFPANARSDELGRGVNPLARSFIDRLALSPSFRPISSRRLLEGILNDGPSSGSSIPSSARGVANRVPHVKSDGISAGDGEASWGKRG